MSTLLTFDFRGDVERMDLLKALPLRPVPLVLGQLFAPVAFVSVVQAGALLAVAATGTTDVVSYGLTAALPFVVPFNFILCAIDNLLFLLFPSRTQAGSISDFQLMGRYVLLNLAKFLILSFAAVAAMLAGLPVYFVFGNVVIALVVAWLVLAAVGAGLVPLLALAFTRFDVARDTPP
jgi:hypothetical protein